MLRRTIKQFSKHPVAANLLMSLMLLTGIWAIWRLNVQFLPNFDIEIVQVNMIWTGASSQDIMTSIINPIEQEFKDLNHVKKMNATARLGQGIITIEFHQHTDMQKATQDVRDRVERVRNLPDDMQKPVITQIESYETIAKLIVSGPKSLDEFRSIVYQFERELLELGISKIEIIGLPGQEIRIEVPSKQLADLRMSLSDIGNAIKNQSADMPAGIIGRSDTAKQIRSEKKARTIAAFADLFVIHKPDGELLKLKDIAQSIQIKPIPTEPLVLYHGKPAVEMRLLRTKQMNAFKAANTIHQWLEHAQKKYGSNLNLKLYDEQWLLIKGRLLILLKNGLGGLILIITILYLFLNRKIAFWVVVGIPASFMAALAILYLAGGSIDMVSMFAFIMALGIIVDDTIVVGEQALTNLIDNTDLPPIKSINQAAIKMLPPILSSSLTTIAAFLPLFFISGIIGTILFYIPLVVICVIIASVIECFYILPGHLYHSFKHGKTDLALDKVQTFVDTQFSSFRDNAFLQLLNFSLNHRVLTFISCIALFIVSIALIFMQYLHFNFFPSPEGGLIIANARFVIGTPESTIVAFTESLDHALDETLNKDFHNPKLLKNAVSYLKYQGIDDRSEDRGEHVASYIIELISPEERDINNQTFIDAWKKHLQLPAGIENLAITSPRGGPPGKDLDLQLSGTNIYELKDASYMIQNKLRTFDGVFNIQDDLPFGQEQWLLSVTPNGLNAGMTTRLLAQALNAAFTGELVQIYHTDNDEIEVRVMLPQSERGRLNQIDHLPIRTPQGLMLPFHNVGELKTLSAPEILKHSDGKLSIHVTAEIDQNKANANQILGNLSKGFLQEIAKKHHLEVTFRGKAEEQAEAFSDMKYGLLLGMLLIFIILAWVFESYRWPLVVMSAIPLGLTGAIFGHAILQIDLTILSLFGLFGLSGIVINDSIILINEYRTLKHSGIPIRDAVIQAAKNRLRAVLLTSMTTIAGLTPLLFERSLQAQFLIPMATSICFGLAYATIIILILIPTLLYTIDSHKEQTI